MSFLIGQFHFDGRPCDMHRLNAVLDDCSEHGPDGRGVWNNGPAAFGHLMRFSTPESVSETLPAATRSGRLAITADARIDYRDELASALGIPAADLKQMADSQLILHAWQEWGDACPPASIGPQQDPAIWQRCAFRGRNLQRLAKRCPVVEATIGDQRDARHRVV